MDDDTDAAPVLRPYNVTRFGYTTVMQLNDTDAAACGDAATPLV